MKYKNYLDEEKEGSFGIIIEGVNKGKLSYIEDPEIKEVEIEGEFVPNEGYNPDIIKQRIIDKIKADDKFIIYLCAFNGGSIDDWIATETRPRVVALYRLIKTQVVIPYLQKIKQQIEDNA